MMGHDGQGREAVARRVSHETLVRLDLIATLLNKWQATINLVAPASLPDLWHRHIADSLQLLDHVPPKAKTWTDLGSGGGFPGLVVAAVLADQKDAHVNLVESDTRKAAFLREASRVAGLPVTVHARRIEQVAPALALGCDIVSARALAPLPKLLDLAQPFLEAGALGIFPKGQDFERELTEARKTRTFKVDIRRSQSGGEGRILLITRGEPAACLTSPAPVAGREPPGHPSHD